MDDIITTSCFKGIKDVYMSLHIAINWMTDIQSNMVLV